MSDYVLKLPDGWYSSDEATKEDLMSELNKELIPGHLLYEKKISIVADRRGGTDDILVAHVNDPDRFTVVHLTWIGGPEISSEIPTVECDGTFSDFLEYDRSFYTEPNG
jgi:hypothetical protein